MSQSFESSKVLHANVKLLGHNVLAYYYGRPGAMWVVDRETGIQVMDKRQATLGFWAANKLRVEIDGKLDITKIIQAPARVTVLVAEGNVIKITLEDTELSVKGDFYLAVDESVNNKTLKNAKYAFQSKARDGIRIRNYLLAYIEEQRPFWKLWLFSFYRFLTKPRL